MCGKVPVVYSTVKHKNYCLLFLAALALLLADGRRTPLVPRQILPRLLLRSPFPILGPLCIRLLGKDRMANPAMQKLLIIFGILLIVAGVLWPWLHKLPLGRLPGDIVIDRPNLKVYLPLTTMVLISALLSLILWIIRK